MKFQRGAKKYSGVPIKRAQQEEVIAPLFSKNEQAWPEIWGWQDLYQRACRISMWALN
jgi:hypothetical protein